MKKCTLLCEDKQHAVFARNFLQKKGWYVSRVHYADSGKGSGEQYVRDEYPKRLEAARKTNIALVVMIDGDNLGAQKRMRQLDEECRAQDVDKRQKNDAIAVFVPEPNIEKWIHYLHGTKAGAGKLRHEKECRPAVRKLLDICDGGGDFPAGFPDSLKHACGEWRRFL